MNRRNILKAASALLVLLCLAAPRGDGIAFAYPGGFILTKDVIEDIELDIKYYGKNNFVGAPIDSYKVPEAIMTVESAAALKQAALRLGGQGYRIKIFDAYRPAAAVAHFVRWGRDLKDTRQKDIFYPDVNKADLFKKGYIASKSGHSRGSVVDMTIVYADTGEEVDMGSPFDFFGEISHPASKLVTPEQFASRKILSDAMIASGFKPLDTEWWHFILAKEPYPDKYFDFPVDYPDIADEKTSALLDALSGGSEKIITVFPDGENTAVVRAYRLMSGEWTRRFETPGFLGKNGIKGEKREGDGATPTGVFTFGRAFGVADDPGSTMKYTKVSDSDVWVDDPDSAYYNQWVDKNSSDADWKSVEHLSEYAAPYKYAASINYNTDPVEQGKGSAIFLHCSTGKPTAGCVAVSESAMIFFLVFIDETTKIVIGTEF
jgi:D-alanyl-D-alanine dipeptidase/L,D-peptidoglycan transpeptidase YkuD (ErfK/YbiS/YcfS/YnhG family)